MREIPDGPEVRDKQNQGQQALKYRKMIQSGNILKPVFEMKEKDIDGEQKDGQNGKAERQTLIPGDLPGVVPFTMSFEKAFKNPPTVNGKCHPSQKKH